MPRVASTRRASEFSYLLCLAQGRPVFTADYYAVDGGTGKVSGFIDWNDPSHVLQQFTPGNQVALPVARVALNNALAFDFANNQEYVSNRSASYFKFLHDGTGHFTLSVFEPRATSNSGTLWATYTHNAEALHHGSELLYTPTINALLFKASRASATPTFSVNPASPAAYGIGTSIRTEYSETTAPKYLIARNASVLASSSTTNVPSNSNPTFTLTIGRRPGVGDSQLNGYFALLMLTGTQSTAGLAAISAYTTQKYGVAA